MYDYTHYVETHKPLTHNGISNRNKSSHDTRFAGGTKSLAEAIALVEGWHDGVKLIEAFANPVVNRITSMIHHQEITFDTSGHSFDIARVLTNEPESWLNYEQSIQESKGTRVLRIGANLSTSGGVDVSQINLRGSFIAALVQCLELGGFSCEVFGIMSTRDYSGNHMETVVRVKSPDQELDLPRLAFALIHPAMFRRIWFAVMERTPETAHTAPGYGYPEASLFEKTCDISFPKQYLGEHFTEARLMTILESQGITLNHESEEK